MTEFPRCVVCKDPVSYVVAWGPKSEPICGYCVKNIIMSLIYKLLDSHHFSRMP